MIGESLEGKHKAEKREKMREKEAVRLSFYTVQANRQTVCRHCITTAEILSHNQLISSDTLICSATNQNPLSFLIHTHIGLSQDGVEELVGRTMVSSHTG